MIKNNKKHCVSDPAFYDPLIREQKRRVSQHPKDAEQLLEHGCLHEARIEMIRSLAKRTFSIRYFIPMYLLLVSAVVIFGNYIFSMPQAFISTKHFTFYSVTMILISISLGWMWSLRFPRSGWKYFKRAVFVDRYCADAYMHLGLIALRRHQKRTACRYLEQAIKLNVNNKEIERELKTIYEKEFMAFFKGKSEKEAKLQKIIDSQQEQIKELRSKVSSLENLTESLSDRADQAKWEVNHKTKLLTKQMKDQIEAIQTEYENQLVSVKISNESMAEEKEFTQRDFVKLTTEILEAKAELKGKPIKEAAKAVEEEMGSDMWQSLLPRTRTYLATAEHTFCMLAEEEDTPDYSLIGMELCKALEAEINRILVSPFLQHLNGNEREFLKINQVGENRGKPRYFTYLAQVVDRNNYPEIKALTLGQYHFILQRTLKGEYALREYRSFLDQIGSSSKGKIGKRFLKRLETVTNRYRNAIAHESPMSKKQCMHLRRLIFTENEALLKTCCRFVDNKKRL